jgi:hypothetical protein
MKSIRIITGLVGVIFFDSYCTSVLAEGSRERLLEEPANQATFARIVKLPKSPNQILSFGCLPIGAERCRKDIDCCGAGDGVHCVDKICTEK